MLVVDRQGAQNVILCLYLEPVRTRAEQGPWLNTSISRWPNVAHCWLALSESSWNHGERPKAANLEVVLVALKQLFHRILLGCPSGLSGGQQGEWAHDLRLGVSAYAPPWDRDTTRRQRGASERLRRPRGREHVADDDLSTASLPQRGFVQGLFG